MLRASKCVLCFGVLLISTAIPSRAASLKAGVAKVDITPPAGMAMWGYFSRTAPATGTLDPLFARVLVLEAGETRLAFVVMDLGRTFGPASLARLREAARKTSGISYVLVHATHTHAGPVILDEPPSNGVPPDWETAALDKIARAIDEAHQKAVEARIGTGRGSAFIGYNRVRVNLDGTVTMFWRNETRVPTAPVDPTVTVVRVDAADGRPIAVLVNYACHPVIFGADNLQYSADFPGAMVRTVEAALGGQAMAFFLQGAPGDINPYDATTRIEKDAVAKRDAGGEQLGQEAARVAQAIKTEPASEASLEFAEELFKFRLRWDPAKFRESIVAAYGEKILETFAPRIQPEIEAPLTVVLINKRIALMGMPGEPFVDYQINWRDRCPAREALFLGYTNGYLGYFPTIRAAATGGYGADSATTWIEPGAGERMVDRAIIRVYEMLGRLSDTPEDLKRR